MEDKKEIRFSLSTFLLTLLIIAILSALVTATVIIGFGGNSSDTSKDISAANKVLEDTVVEKPETPVEKTENVSDENIYSMDFNFLKAKNEEENKIYSPLSIRYALNMLKDGSNGTTKDQITNLITDRALTKYNSNANLSLANALFVRDTYENSINKDYIKLLNDNYNAETIADSFESSENVNAFVAKKTLNLLPNLLPDGPITNDFLLINALAIDLEWVEKFVHMDGYYSFYPHTNFSWSTSSNVVKYEKFNNTDLTVSGMDIGASVFKYKAVDDYGEQNIRDTVSKAFVDWKNSDQYYGDSEYEDKDFLPKFLDKYIEDLNNYYGSIEKSTEFEFFVNDDVKVFAKKLKESDNTNLQYVGIMPINESLTSYIEKVDDAKVNELISNLKSFERFEDFEEGYITRVKGFIPKFSFDYELDLKEQLNALGVTDIFDVEKADISGIVEAEGAYISDAIHKANIEFTQDGIKAAAVTEFGGLGAGDPFDYYLEMKVKEIDLTFDKPYMFIVRDVKTGEVWFTGTVYEPLNIEDEPEKDRDSLLATYEK